MATIGVLLAAATLGVSTAQAAISRLPVGGNYVWQFNRTRNINFTSARGHRPFANWFTASPVLQPTMVSQPVSTYYPDPHTGNVATVGSLVYRTPYTIGLQTSLFASYINWGCVTTNDVAKTTTSGTLTLSGANIYSGTTIVSGSPTITTGAVTTTSGQVINLSSLSGTSGTLTSGGTTYSYTTDSSGSVRLTPTSGNLTVTSGFYTGSSGSITVASVPEPTSVGLLLCTGGWLLHRRRR